MEASEEILVGIDEAGRGPLIGTMVIAGVAMKKRDIEILAGLGVRDSKRLSRSRREALLESIVERALMIIVTPVSPVDIDRENINEIEVRAVERILGALINIYGSCPKTYIDLFTKEDRIARLKKLCIDIVAEHGADSRYTVVAAASIVAKVLRDWHIDGLRRALGDFGSGYPSDPRTMSWISSIGSQDLLRASPFIRHRWATVKRLEVGANTLDKYIING